MELGAFLAFFALFAVFIAFFVVGIYSAVRRMQGRPTRFDRLYELFARLTGAERAGIYPASLRGDPDPQFQEDVEVSRADRATRQAPGERP